MMRGGFRAMVTATAAAGIGVTAFAPRPLFVVTVAAITAVFAAGWPGLLGLPARRRAAALILAVGAASLALVELTGDLAWVALVFALSIPAAFISEMLRQDGRPQLLRQVSGIVSGSAVVASASGWLAIGDQQAPEGLLVCSAVALAAAAIITAIGLPSLYSAVTTILVGTLAGVAIGFGVPEVGMVTGALVGLAAGLLIATMHRMLTAFPRSSPFLPALAAALLAVAVSGVPVYVLGRLLLA